MSEKKTVFDVAGYFYGLIGRQRKIQFQSLRVENLEIKPSDDEARAIILQEVEKHNARKITNSNIKITVSECEVEEMENGIRSKTHRLCCNKTNHTFQIDVNR